MFIHLDGMM